MSKNNRRFVRVEINAISNIKRQAISKQFEEELKADILNISVGGIYFETGQPLPEGTLFEFEFKLPDSNKTVKAKGMVVWVSKKRNATSMGVKFIKISTNDKAAILNYIQAKLEEKGLSIEEYGDDIMIPERIPQGFEGLVYNKLHQQFLRIYFKEIGFDLSLDDILAKMACSEESLKIILKTFEKCGVIQRTKDKVNFYYAEDPQLRSKIEQWINENGV